MKGKSRKNVGRPSMGDKKAPVRQISSDYEAEQFLKEHPEINASLVYRRAIHAIMPKDPDTIRLSKLAQEISDLRVELSIKEAEYNSLKTRVDDREKLQLDMKLEQDCHAWYFRSLVQAGIFRVLKRDPIDPIPIVKQLMAEKRIHAYEVEETEEGYRLTDKASNSTFRILRRHIGKNNLLIPSEPETWLAPSENDLYDRYSLKLDYKMFEKEYINNPHIDELPLDYFRQFSPMIRGNTQEREDSIKRETKQKMMPFYQNPPEISVDEAKTRIEKPYSGED